VHPGLARHYPVAHYPLIYANTVATVRLLHRFASPGRILVHHIHELGEATRQLGLIEAMRRGVARTDLYIAPSEAVFRFLMDGIGVPPERIRVIPEFAINVPGVGADRNHRQAIRTTLGLPADCCLVGMAGTPEERKGTDLFVRLAERVQRSSAAGRIRFLWLGGSVRTQRPYRELARRLGLEGLCMFQPQVSRPQDWLGAMDLFALTSREDPFPVVMLEAAAAGMPVICFAGAGGAPELVGSDAGLVVPYLDLEAMASACLRLAGDARLRQQLGRCARLKVMEQYRLEHQAPPILKQLQRLIDGPFDPRPPDGACSTRWH
jgi:glycosyltransferase involved in cell wall biosynthesis